MWYLRIHCPQRNALAWLQVEEMALNNIVLQQANGIKVFYPITRMFTEPLYNVTRSSNRWEGFRVMHQQLLSVCMAFDLTTTS